MDAVRLRECPARTDREAAALLTLLRLPGVADRTTLRLLRVFGSAGAALDAPARSFAEVAGDDAAAARGDPELTRRVEEGLRRCAREGVSVRVRGREGYPERLLDLPDPPAVVFLRGDEALLARPALAVVGSRRSTVNGRRLAEEVGAALAGRGVVTLSGLALGIDAAAHRGALGAGGPTAAVLGTGPDVVYPRANGALFDRIGAEGLLVTEFLPGEEARPYHFPRRNRLIAALSGGVVVIEAALRSGALVTVRHALDLGRPVAAAPGSVYAPQSAGANRLLRDGAFPLVEPSDAIALLSDPELLALEEAPPPPDAPASGDAALVWEALGGGALGVDEVVRASALPAERVLAALTALEVGGRVVREPGGRIRRASG